MLAMGGYAAKVLVTALAVVAISEVAKRSTFWAAALASLPITSLLAFVWMHLDGGKPQQIADLSMGVFWLVIPSLLLFVVLAAMLRSGFDFWLSLGVSCVATALAYLALVALLQRVGIRL